MTVTVSNRDQPRSTAQQLGAELSRLRTQAGISGRQLAQRLGVSQSKVSRIETGRTVPSLPVVAAWGKAIGVPDDTQEHLTELAQAAFTEVCTWRTVMRERPHFQGIIEEREIQAHAIHTYNPSVVPGLLQTAEYARRIFSLVQVPYSDENIAQAVAGRLQRQLLLYEESRQFDFLITEAALRWSPGPKALLLAQLDRIASLSTLSNVSIGIITLDTRPTVVVPNGFVAYDHYDDLDAFISIETVHANVIVNDPQDVEMYRESWSLLARMAIFGSEARAFLVELSSGIRSSSTDASG